MPQTRKFIVVTTKVPTMIVTNLDLIDSSVRNFILDNLMVESFGPQIIEVNPETEEALKDNPI